MSSYFTSIETRCLVTDIVASVYGRENEKEMIFEEVSLYNLISLNNEYNDPMDMYDDSIGHYTELNESFEQEIKSLGNYLYQCNHIKNEVIDELTSLYEYSKPQIKDVKGLYWDIHDKYDDELKELTIPKKTSKEIWKEKGYDKLAMKDIAKLIRKDLKKRFGNTIKFSVTSERYPEKVEVRVKAIDKEIANDLEEIKKMKEYSVEVCTRLFEEGYSDIIVPKETIEIIKNIISEYNYDNSDIMVDYFDVGFYGGYCSTYGVKII